MGIPRPSSLVSGQYVTPGLFKHQLDFLTRRGCENISLQKITLNSETQENKFAITFDDGYLSVFEEACPILSSRNMTATIFTVTDVIGGINEWDHRRGDRSEPMMTAKQIVEISNAGFEIGSHTLSHPHLSELPEARLLHEVKDSKNKLEDIIQKPVVSFSYPYGDYNKRVIEIVKESGYKYATATRLGIIKQDVNEFEIPRINVRWNAIPLMLSRKIRRAQRASGL